ncbi:MAG: hypothetical protein AB1416_05920 [Actinomycetota bacterium]
MTLNLRERLHAAGQGHLADALDRVSGDARERLRADIEGLDLDLVARLVDEHVRHPHPPPALDDL